MRNATEIFWSIPQLVTYYGVTRQTIYAWIRSGRIAASRPHPYGGRYWLIDDLPSKKKESRSETAGS